MLEPNRSGPQDSTRIIEDAVLNWLRSVPPEQLYRYAHTGYDIAGELVQQYPPLLRRMAHALLGPQGLERIRRMNGADWQRIVDRALRECPAHGRVLWQYEQWWHRQLQRARDLFVAP